MRWHHGPWHLECLQQGCEQLQGLQSCSLPGYRLEQEGFQGIRREGHCLVQKARAVGQRNFETGGTFSPTIRNGAGAYYFGLIQFGKDAALDLSRVYKDPRVTVEWLITLSAEEQLDWVFKYFEMWMKRGKKYNRLEDFYLTIFYPAAVGKKPDEVIFSKDVEKERLGYTQNKGFDFDKDGRITVGEINTRLYTSYYDGMLASNRSPSSAHY